MRKRKKREVKRFGGLSQEDGPLGNAQNLKAHEPFVHEKKTNSLMASIWDARKKKGWQILESLVRQADNLEFYTMG